MNTTETELVIIGGGPAGLTAGLYATRAGLDTLLIERVLLGGQLVNIYDLENYPGFPRKISGLQLTQRLERQARKFGLHIITGQEVLQIKIEDHKKRIKTSQAQYLCQSTIIATGTQPRKLGVPGEEEFLGRGVSYCAICDAPLFKNREVVVVGGSNSAINEALYLAKFAYKVKIIYRGDKLPAAEILQQRAFAQPKIEFIWNAVVEEIRGDQTVKEIVLRILKTDESQIITTTGVFPRIGVIPYTKFVEGLLDLDPRGYIITSEDMQTSIPGIFAAGDCRQKHLRQIVTAAADGATAAMAAKRYISYGDKSE